MENLDPNTQPIPGQPTDTTPPPTQTISAAQLAASRSNAQKSTGPRTPQGKLRSASSSMKHGLYSLTSYLDQFKPVATTEVGLVHQQLRLFQMEFLLNQAMSFRVEDILKIPVDFLPHLMREFDRLPARIERFIKAPSATSRHLSQRRVQLVPIGLLPESTKRSHALPA